jgi:formate hydrogenlyase transcriptional activator
MTDLLLRPQSLPDLFVAMAERLRQVAAAEAASFSLHDPQKNVMCLHVWDDRQLASLELPVEESPSGWAWQRQEPLVVPDVSKDFRFPLERDILRDKGLDSYCCLPLSTAEKRLGAIGFGGGASTPTAKKTCIF